MQNSSTTSAGTPLNNAPPPERPGPPPLDFKRLSGPIRRGSFICGEREIDAWCGDAHKDHEKLKLRVTTGHLRGNAAVAGLYALRIRLESDKDIGGHGGVFRTEYGYFSAVQLCYVAVQRQLQRQGIGRLLMARAIQEFGQVALSTGVCAMTLVSIDEAKARFYESLGFRRYGAPCNQPKMFLPARSAIELLEG